MIYLVFLLIYLVALLGVGVYKSRQVRSQDDFMVAGRSLKLPILVGTLLATWMGSGSLLAGAGLAYREGISALWLDVGSWTAACIVFFFAARVRKFGQYTVSDILEARYNTVARFLGSLVTIIAYTAIVSYQFKAGGLVLHYVADIPAETGVMITAAFVIGFTVLAGLLSVAAIDTINGVVMIGGLLIAFPLLYSRVGGLGGLQDALPVTMFEPMGTLTFFKALSYTLPTMLLFLGEANMFQRFFSAKDEATAKRAVGYWILGTSVLILLIAGIAIMGRAIEPGLVDHFSEGVIIHLARFQVPTFLGCLMLAAAVSMIVSTADSFLLSPVNNIVHDFYQKILKKKATPKKMVLISRIVTVVLGLFAFMQLQYFSGILEMALYAYTMYGVGITPAVMAAFFWKRATPQAGVASILGGMIVTLIWEIGGVGAPLSMSLPEALRPLLQETVYPALFASVGLLVVVSLFTPAPKAEKWKPFF